MAKRKQVDFNAITLRLETSHRGGGVEIDLTTLGFKNERMSAYQNYLGGGMLGSICTNNTIQAHDKPHTQKQAEKLAALEEALKQHYYLLTNPQDVDREEYDELQVRPSSAY